MLGWFKKKFSKKEQPPEVTEAALDAEEREKDLESSFDVEIEDTHIDSPPPSEHSAETSQIESQPEQLQPAPPPPLVETPASLEPDEDSKADGAPSQVEDEDSVAPEKSKKRSLFESLSKRLDKTRESFTYQMDALFLGKKEIDETMLDDLEELLVTADIGVGTSMELIETARRRIKRKELKDPEGLKRLIKDEIKTFIAANDADATLVMPDSGPFVIMVIGVNGVGKTTTIGKIAHKFKNVGSSVMLVAADTFRAAAVSQLKIWGERNDVPVISHKEGADPSSVVFDGLEQALSKNVDVVLVDTAGRMHTKDNLMEELKKIRRVMHKKLPGAPHEVLLVIDATTGQNGISQARLFDAAVQVTGLALTKLDGTSKGGIVANICREMNFPIRFIGVGEKVEDLRDFDAEEFVDALFD